MPVTTTYPGVYIEEIPSGVRTIGGVATSITAFIGRALRGPVNKPVTINNFGDFERIFGGLWVESTLGFAVRDFYLNGGGQAIIVRLHNGATAATLNLPPADGGLVLEAASPGTWGNALRARVDYDVSDDVAESYGLDPETNPLFNLSILDTKTGKIEIFRNVTVVESPRNIEKVLDNQSSLVRISGNLPTSRPEAHNPPEPNEDEWGNSTSTKVEEDGAGVDGDLLTQSSFTGKETSKEGIYALEKADLFNLLCIPPHLASGNVDSKVVTDAAAYCEKRRAFFILDAPNDWKSKKNVKDKLGSIGTKSKNAAIFFPRLKQPNPLKDNQMEDFASCGAVAGVIARTDSQRGIWKAPAGLEATLVGVPQLSVPLTDAENGELNPLGVNCLRTMPPAGRIIWGSRTLQGDDRLASEWKYIPVRRLALYIEESLYRGTHWVVFEPNDEPLWAQIRLNVGAFMNGLFRQGAFAGKAPSEAYFVKCDKETTTQTDINSGVVNIMVGFAPLKPAEFVIIKIQQMAGQIEA